MLQVTGTVMNVVDSTYVKDGQPLPQADLVVWPDAPGATETVAVQYGNKYFADAGFLNTLNSLRGKKVTVTLKLFTFKTGGGYKLLAQEMPQVNSIKAVS